MLPSLWASLTVVVYLCMRERWNAAAGALFLGLAAIFSEVHHISLPRSDLQSADNEILRRLQARLTAQDEVVSTGGDARRQWFYLNRNVKLGAEAATLSTTPGVYVISELKPPVARSSTVKLEHIDQGITIVIDRIVP